MNPVILTLLAATLMTPPAGRPPTGPLERIKPKLYDLTFKVQLGTVLPTDVRYQRSYNLKDAPIVMPIIFRGSFSKVYNNSLSARLWLFNGEDMGFHRRSRVDEGLPFHTHAMIMPVAQYRGTKLNWQLSFRTQVWESRLNDRAAQNLTWPEKWPEEVSDGLKPQLYIESDDPMFARSIKELTRGNLRLAPPYLAAKEIIRLAITRTQVSGTGTARGFHGEIQGLNLQGAKQTWLTGKGTEHDLVCVCVALLRAADIPARPVIGVFEDERTNRDQFKSWVEFYMVGAGWIPFDPDEMRGKAIANLNIRDPWPDLGTLKDLNDWIPLSYFFIPPLSVEAPYKPIVWGWDPRPGGDPSTIPVVSFSMISRGQGKEDPR